MAKTGRPQSHRHGRAQLQAERRLYTQATEPFGFSLHLLIGDARSESYIAPEMATAPPLSNECTSSMSSIRAADSCVKPSFARSRSDVRMERGDVDYGSQVDKHNVPAVRRSGLAGLILCALSNQV